MYVWFPRSHYDHLVGVINQNGAYVYALCLHSQMCGLVAHHVLAVKSASGHFTAFAEKCNKFGHAAAAAA